jgi:hypothetical protein
MKLRYTLGSIGRTRRRETATVLSSLLYEQLKTGHDSGVDSMATMNNRSHLRAFHSWPLSPSKEKKVRRLAERISRDLLTKGIYARVDVQLMVKHGRITSLVAFATRADLSGPSSGNTP